MATASPLEIGAVLTNLFGLIGRNPGTTIGLAIGLTGIPMVVFDMMISIGDRYASRGMIEAQLLTVMAGLGAFVGYLILGMVLQAAIAIAAVNDHEEEPGNFDVCFGRAIGRFAALFGYSLVWGAVTVVMGVVIVLVATLFFRDPEMLTWVAGIASLIALPMVWVLSLLWICVVPLIAVEKAGPFGAIARSTRVTRGSRLQIFLIMLVVAVIGATLYVLQIVLSEVGHAPGMIARGLSAALMSAIWSAAAASIYLALREQSAFADAETVGEIFA